MKAEEGDWAADSQAGRELEITQEMQTMTPVSSLLIAKKRHSQHGSKK